MKLSFFDKLKLFKLSQNKVMIAKLQSRKLWATVIAAALATLGSQLGVDSELVNKLIEMVMVYITAQAVVDTMEAKRAA